MMIYKLDKINEMADGDTDFVHAIITIFLKEIPQDLINLEDAVETSNFEQIGKIAHKIKPNVDLFGMTQTLSNAQDLEKLGKGRGDLSEIRNKFSSFRKDLEQAIVELRSDFNL